MGGRYPRSGLVQPVCRLETFVDTERLSVKYPGTEIKLRKSVNYDDKK